MWLFLITLSILFLASLAGYIIIRVLTLNPGTDPTTGELLRQPGPALGSIDVPAGLWVSTAVMLISSYTIHHALRAVQAERLATFRKALVVTLALAVVFLIVQTPSLIQLLNRHNVHQDMLREQANLGLEPYGMVFFLIVVHALHLIGGIIPLAVITRNAFRDKYDHEFHGPVKYTTMYWHFLDVVWVCLFVAFMLVG